MPGSRTVAVLVAAVAATGGAREAAADGMVIVGGSPRSIGRAGADEIGDDGGGALLIDPAALARRDAPRAQVGLSWIDDTVAWRPDDTSAPVAHGQIGSLALPMVAVAVPVGDWILAAAAMTAAQSNRSLTRPDGVPPAAFGAQFAYRYAGLGGGVRRDTVTLGAARRLGDEIAVGLALGGSRVLVAETRDLWAGFAGIHPPGDPRDDVTIALTGETAFAPSAVAGLLFAPNDTALELAVSVGWAGAAHLDGAVAAAGVDGGPRVALANARAHMDLAQPWTIRAGARYAGERWIAELDGDLWVFPTLARDEAWALSGVTVGTGPITAPVSKVASRLAPLTHGAVRGAVDVALAPGFLWATAGYAYTTRGTPSVKFSPTFADLGGHTVGVGLEANAGGVTITIGASRTWATDVRASSTQLQLDNPFAAGDGPVPLGTYSGTVDQVGVLVDAEL